MGKNSLLLLSWVIFSTIDRSKEQKQLSIWLHNKHGNGSEG